MIRRVLEEKWLSRRTEGEKKDNLSTNTTKERASHTNISNKKLDKERDNKDNTINHQRNEGR